MCSSSSTAVKPIQIMPAAIQFKIPCNLVGYLEMQRLKYRKPCLPVGMYGFVASFRLINGGEFLDVLDDY
jgi:hypothetical protein